MEIRKSIWLDTSRLTWRASSLAIAVYFLAFLLVLSVWPSEFGLDDAYITLSNARALLTGNDSVYGASPLLGATSAVHLALVAFFGLFVPLQFGSMIISSIAVVLYGAGLKALAEGTGCRRWQTAVIVFVGLCIGYQPFQYFNGLETSLAMAAVAWALVLANSRYLPILCGLLPYIRPELAFLAAPLFFRRLYLVRDWQWSFGTAIAAALPFALWYIVETGLPFPNTGEAKIAFFAEIHLPILERLKLAADAIAGSLLFILILGVPRLLRVPAGWCVAVFLALWMALAVLTLPSLLTHNFYRYLAPAVPALCLPLAARISSGDGPSKLVALMSVIWTAVSLVICLPNISKSAEFYHNEGMNAAKFVRDEIPSGSTVLIHDAGLVAWLRPPSHLVDIVGLKTPGSTAYHKRFTRHDCQWGKALDGIARDSGATYLVVLHGVWLWPCVGNNLKQQGWKLQSIREPTGMGYAVYRISPP